MPVKRRKAKQRRAEVCPDVRALLSDREGDHPVRFFMTNAELRAAWNEVKDEILESWAREEPGIRPLHWWRFDSPEPRRRLGGVGQPAHECSAHVEAYELGLPTVWVLQDDSLAGVPIDPADPPRFESEAVYLERHGLLLPGELDRLSDADFLPETVEAEAAPDEDEAPEAA